MPKGRFFAQPDDLTRIDFDEGVLAGEWIQVRTRLSFAEEQNIQGEAVSGLRQELGSDGTMQSIVDIEAGKYQVAQIRAWVKRWSLEGDHEKGARPSDEALRQLLPEYAAALIVAIEAHEARVREAAEDVATDPKPATGSESTTEPPTGV